jgi:phosphotransferase system IIB component
LDVATNIVTFTHDISLIIFVIVSTEAVKTESLKSMKVIKKMSKLSMNVDQQKAVNFQYWSTKQKQRMPQFQ